MGWVRLDDLMVEHPKVLAAGAKAAWLHVCAIAYCNRQLTDGFVPAQKVGRLADLDDTEALAQRLVEAGLWEEADGGWAIHDYLEYQPSSTSIRDRRGAAGYMKRRRALMRDRDLVAAIRQRDGDTCRYCGQIVDWADRKGAQRGTYDHVDPKGGNDLENVVVACGSCNSRKGHRTPTEAHMDLIPIGSEPDTAQVRPDRDLDNPYPSPSPTTEEASNDAPSGSVRTRTIDQGELPEGLLPHLIPVASDVLEVLARAQHLRGGQVPGLRGVGLALAAFPRRDHLAIVRDLEHWATAGRGQRRNVKDWVATYRSFLKREPDADTAPRRLRTNVDVLRVLEGGAA